ncbi:hypothetical protein FOVSG1_006628 [Fusarium oxysporum f. sp. vasinfectum]
MTAQNGDAGNPANLVSPNTLCHIVLHTASENYQKMVDFYLTFLGAHVTFQNARMTFLTYDYEHHRIAIVGLPGLKPRVEGSVGMSHIAFGFETLDGLATSYEQKKAKGIMPMWTVNHGPSTSMYYSDPDGNVVEMQVDNFDTAEEATDFMMSKSFDENPIGVDFDPEDFVKRVRSGEDDKLIKARPDIGPRTEK